MTTALLMSLAVGLTLGVLGGGGSILMLPIMVHALGMGAKPAIASSLLVVAAASLTAGTGHALRGRVAWRDGSLFAFASMFASFMGGRLAQVLPAPLLLAAFAGVMLMTGLAMLKSSSAAAQRARRPLHALLAGVGVGLLTGTVGAGGGFLVVPALTMFAGLEMSRAVGTSLFVIALNSLAGFAGYAGHVTLPWHEVALVALFAAAGSSAGSLLVDRVSPGGLRRAFGVLVMANALWLGAQQWPTQLSSVSFAGPTMNALLGGVLIGVSASLLLATHGRIAGVSGILAGVLARTTGDIAWRAWFIAGLLSGGALIALRFPQTIGGTTSPLGLVAASGLLVGFGTRLAGGCTSGHGVCGLSRLSPRSLAATSTFMVAGVLATYLVRHALGQGGAP